MRTRAIGCRPVDAEFSILHGDAQWEYQFAAIVMLEKRVLPNVPSPESMLGG
jgi:hypothetical protein